MGVLMPPRSQVPYAVLVGLDPLVGLAEVAERAGKSRPAVANWRARDPRFPAPIAELKSGPVFALSAVDDYLAIRDGHPTPATAQRLRQLDAEARTAGPHTDWANPTPADIEILLHNRVGMHLSPFWQWNSELTSRRGLGPIGGGTWMLGHFTEDDNSETGEAVEPVWKVRLPELMARRDWEVWLTLHVQHLDQVVDAALALTHADDADTGSPHASTTAEDDGQEHQDLAGGRDQQGDGDDRSVRLALGTLALTAMLDELADAVVEHGEELQQRPEILAPIAARFALSLVVGRATEAASKDILDDVRSRAHNDVELSGKTPRPADAPDATITQAVHPASTRTSIGNHSATPTRPRHPNGMVEEPGAEGDPDDPPGYGPVFALATAPSRAALQAYEWLVGLSQHRDFSDPVGIAMNLALRQLLAGITDYDGDDLDEIWWRQRSETTAGVRLITSKAFTIVGARATWQLRAGIATDHGARDWARPLIADLVRHVAVEYDVEPWSADAYSERARRLGLVTTVGGLLIARRRQLRLTRQELAAASSVHANSIGNWELGNTRPGRRSLPRLAKGLQVPEPVLVDALAGIRHQDVWPLPDVDPNQRLI
jgi:hypothetical protein